MIKLRCCSTDTQTEQHWWPLLTCLQPSAYPVRAHSACCGTACSCICMCSCLGFHFACACPLRRVLSFSQDQHSWLCKAQVISLRFSLQCYQNYSRSGKSELGKSTKSKSKQEGQSCATSRAGEPLKYTEWNCTDTRWYPIIFATRLPWKVSQLCIETGVIRLLRPLNCWPQMNHAPLCTHQSSCR